MIEVIKKLNYKHPKVSEIIRFLIIGGLSTFIDLFVMSIIIYFPNRLLFQNSLINVFLNKHIASGLLVAFASCVGFICGLIFNYIFSLKFVYYGENKKARTKKGFLIFSLLSACGLLIETVGVYLGYEIFKFNEWIIKIILIFIVLIFNYFTRKKFLFFSETLINKVDEKKSNINLNGEDKIKIEKFLFVVLFAIYFIISCVSIFYINSTDWGYVFGVDSPRVFDDWTKFNAGHYRTKVHPLYVLLIYPIVNLFIILGANPVIAVVIFLCVIATLNVYLLYKTMLKISKNKCSLVAVVLTIIYAFSFTQVENLMAIESFIVSTFSVLLFWYYFVLKFGTNIKNKKDYMYLTLLGVLSFSMLLTNFMHFIIGLSFLILFNKKKKGKEFFKDLIPFITILFISICISFVLTCIQEIIFTSSSNAFKYVLSMFKDVIMGTKNSEEFSYINFNITGNNFLNILLFFFGISFSGGNIGVGDNGLLTIESNIFTYSTIILVISLLVISVYSIIKNKKYFAVPLSLAFLYEIIIHLFYGNDELMLYIIQPTFILLILLSIGLSDIDFKNKKTCWIKYVLLGLMLISFCSSFVSAIILLFKMYTKYGFSHLYLFGENKRFIAFIILVLLVYLFVNYVLRKTQKINISSNIKKLNYKSLLFALLFSFSIILSTYVVPV